MKANKCQHALFKIQQRNYEYGLQVVQLQNLLFIHFGYIENNNQLKSFSELELANA